jgi:hypothetical protein
MFTSRKPNRSSAHLHSLFQNHLNESIHLMLKLETPKQPRIASNRCRENHELSYPFGGYPDTALVHYPLYSTPHVPCWSLSPYPKPPASPQTSVFLVVFSSAVTQCNLSVICLRVGGQNNRPYAFVTHKKITQKVISSQRKSSIRVVSKQSTLANQYLHDPFRALPKRPLKPNLYLWW